MTAPLPVLPCTEVINGMPVQGSPDEILVLHPEGMASGSITLSGAVQAGDHVCAQFNYAELTNGTELVSYTAVGGDTLATVAENLADAINNDAALEAIGLFAAAAGAVITIKLAGDIGPQVSISAYSVAPTETATVSGTFTSGDTAGIRFTNAKLAGSPLLISHTVVSGDTNDAGIATALKNAINANAALQALGISAAVAGAAVAISNPTSQGPITVAGVNGTAQVVTITGAPTEVGTSVQMSNQSGPIIPQKDFNFTYNSVRSLYRAGQPYLVSPDLLAAMVAALCPIK
jgi:hypothetical protein